MRGVTAAVCISLLTASAAGLCFARAHHLRSEASWFLVRSKAEALEYTQSFDNRVADQQLQTFEARRDVLERAHLWQRAQMIFLLMSGIAALCAYALHLLRRLHDQLDEASGMHDVPGHDVLPR